MGKVHSDDQFRAHMMQALVTCSPDVYRYLWISYSDPRKCPLETCLRLRLDPCSVEHRPDSEVIRLILGYGRRW